MTDNNIPSWEQAYTNPTSPEAFQAERQRLAAEQKEPGYIPENMQNWVIGGLPKQHPVSQRIRYYELNHIDYNPSEVYAAFLKGELQ